MLCCAVSHACRTHLSPNHGPFPFPKDMFLKFVRENNGYFPVKIQALPEGTCVHVHTPVYQVFVGPPLPSCGCVLCCGYPVLPSSKWVPQFLAVFPVLLGSETDDGMPIFDQAVHACGRNSCGWVCTSRSLPMLLCCLLQLTAEEEYSPLCTFLETLLTMMW